MDGALLKLTIIPFKDDTTGVLGPPAGPPFIAQFNPETYTDTTEFQYAEPKEAGASTAEAKFDRIAPKKFSFELLLDGTGVMPAPPPAGAFDLAVPSSGLSVVAQLELFKLTVGFRNESHRPNFLLLLWGRLIAFTAIEGYSIAYKLFSPAGLPLRATLSASFREHVPKALAALMQNLASPDIEHAHRMREGDHLSRVVDQVYGTPVHTIDVARANGFDTIRDVAPGTPVYMPPVA
jgi:hypothetical protein